MAFSGRKIVTAMAWGLAFDSVTEMVLAGAYGASCGWKFGKQQDADEVISSLTKKFTPWEQTLPLIIGFIGLSLGLLGLLPGTEDK